ncbi:MAG: hypothetical protein IJ520_02590 [Synergistaceae bacterium]|nr:hypothetical protein [Synergistaceae bacterium]MBR1602756.1 hypothetical protein [Synergistaceae bacterium]
MTMLSPEIYVANNVQGKTRDEILAFIQEEQECIKRLKEIIALPWYKPCTSPSEELRIEYAEECIKLAQAKLQRINSNA